MMMKPDNLSLLPHEDEAGNPLDAASLHRGQEATQARSRFRAEQVKLLYSQSRTELITSLVVAAIVVAVMWELANPTLILGWLAVIMVITTGRGMLVSAYHSSRPAFEEAETWEKRYVAGAAIAGLAWGAAGLLPAFHGGLVHQVFMLFILGGIALGAFVSMISVVRSFMAFLIPSLLPVTAWFTLQGDVLHLSMAALALLTSSLMLTSARRLNTMLAKASNLGVHNSQLIRKLVSAKNVSERANTAMEQANKALQEEVKERQRAEEKIRRTERQLSSILHNMQDTTFRTDQRGKINWLSPSVQSLLGYEADELCTQPMSMLYTDPEAYTRFTTALDARHGKIDNYEMHLRRKDGSAIWVAANSHYYHDDNNTIVGVEGTMRDITDRKFAEEALFQEKERAQVTLESIGDGVITTDVTGIIEYMNPVAEQATGWKMEETRGHPILHVMQLVDENKRQPVPDPVAHCLAEKKAVKVAGHPLLLHQDGKQMLSIELTTAPIRDSSDQVIGAVLVFHDVTELRGLARQMSHQAAHDALTGLINRREFEKRARQALESALTGGVEHALCYLDLDQFKVVNDTCGHSAGDELLKQLTAKLRNELREADTLARLGGDEFGVLLEGCSVENARQISENLRKLVQEFRFGWADQSFRVGVSIGLVPITRETGNLSDLLSAADSACYVAKDHGRNRVHIFQPDDKALAERHGQMQWMQRIQDAVEKDLFSLYFQPILRLQDSGRKGTHGEVLLRMRSEDGSVIGPGAFMPSAERYHLMPVVDKWVVENAFRMLQHREQVLPDVATCAINLSGQSLSSDYFLDFILELVNESGVPPELVCFEITETAVIANLSNATRFISELRKIGCRFALDDFGSGLSSFAYLKNLPVDYLKVDGCFVQNIVEDHIDRAMVEAINQIGHTMNIQTIAEFVENDEILETLREIGIDYAQGFGVARPYPLEIPRN